MALQIRSDTGVSHVPNNRLGSIGTGLVLIFCLVLVLVPFGVQLFNALFEWCLVQRSHHYVQQILPAVEQAVDLSSLSSGQARISPLTARRLIGQLFEAHLPSMLRGRLYMESLILDERILSFDPDHWMGDRQPSYQPIAILEARLDRASGGHILITHAVEILID